MPGNRNNAHDKDRAHRQRRYARVDGLDRPGLGSRIFGARIGAGFVSKREIVDLHGIDRFDYANAERDRRPVEQSILDHAVACYGVTMPYLLDGIPTTATEAVADRLTGIQRRYFELWSEVERLPDEEQAAIYAPLLERLRAIREAAGHSSIDSAALAHGWDRMVYWQHETGTRFIQPDAFMGYCLSMGARPEFGLLGEGTMRETELVEWRERRMPPKAGRGSSWGP